MWMPHCDVDATGIPSASGNDRNSKNGAILNPNEMKGLIYHEKPEKSNAKRFLRMKRLGISRHIECIPQMNGFPQIRPHRSADQKDMKDFGVFQLKKTKNMVQYYIKN